MQNALVRFLGRWSLLQRFTVVSFVIIVSAMAGISWWIGQQIKYGVIKESAVTAALYMDSFISPNLQELVDLPALSSEQVAILNGLLRETDLGQRIVAFKVWDKKGHVLYSKGPSLFSDVFPDSADQARVWQGEVVANIDDSPAERRLEEQKFNSRLLQIYSPIRKSGTNQVIAVAEFYQKVSSLEADVASAQRQSWLVVGSIMAVMYLLLVGFVRRADTTIRNQEVELTQQVDRLTKLLAQNKELHQRVQKAAANATALNERFLRRISADLHDGPTQVLGLALLRLDRVVSQSEVCRLHNPGAACNDQLPIIQTSLQQAMHEMRAIATGFGLPHLESLSFAELLKRVVRTHEQSTGTRVEVSYDPVPEPLDLPVKIAAYRLIQEALNNAYHHAAGTGQHVSVGNEEGVLMICVSDAGPGFDVRRHHDEDGHLGLLGMQGRVESLSGSFRIESEAGYGTRVTARLPLQPVGEASNG